MLEESYEAMEALGSGSVPDMVEELGDLLIQVVFHAQIGAGAGTFTISGVARYANDKLVRRHPHVFGDEVAATAEEVKTRWDAIKGEERQWKGQQERSMLDGVPKTMPALAYAQAVQSRTQRAGFRWEDMSQLGYGEQLFNLVNAARAEDVEAEEALRSINRCFYQRVAGAERLAREQGLELANLSVEERATLWREASVSQSA